MIRIQVRHAVFVFGAIQAALTTGVATAIATLRVQHLDWSALGDWLTAWLMAWLTMLPIVVVFAPLIRRAVLALTVQPGAGPGAEWRPEP